MYISISCRTGYVHNIDSAKVSMIGQLKLKNSDEAATLSFDGDQSDEPCAPGHETISEENDETQESSKPTEVCEGMCKNGKLLNEITNFI